MGSRNLTMLIVGAFITANCQADDNVLVGAGGEATRYYTAYAEAMTAEGKEKKIPARVSGRSSH